MTALNEAVQDRYIVPALANGLAILRLFSKNRLTWTPPDIARELSLPRATVFRLLQTLEVGGYVRRDGSGRSFTLGPALLNHGFAYLASLDIVDAARPILKRLRDETGLSAHLAVRDGREVVYVARVASRGAVASGVHVGTRFPIHATILGRSLISDMSATELERLYPETSLPSFSDQTPKTRESLGRLLAQDQARGYSVSQSFFELGVSAIAAPVRDQSNQVVAAINVIAADACVTAETLNGQLKDQVLKAAAELTSWVGATHQFSQATRRPELHGPAS